MNELHYRLSPDYMKYRVKEKGRETGHSLMDRVKENPLGAAMVGLGLFMMMRKHDDDREYIGYARDYEIGYEPEVAYEPGYATGTTYGAELDRDEPGMADRARERMAGAADSVREKTHDAADTVREKTEEAGERLRHGVDTAKERSREAMHRANMRMRQASMRTRMGARRTNQQFWSAYGDNPLMIGLAGLAVGAVLGAAIPETEKEDEMMGRLSDRATDRLRRQAREKVDQVRDVASTAAGAAADAAKRAARDEAQEIGLTSETSAANRDQRASGGSSGMGTASSGSDSESSLRFNDPNRTPSGGSSI